MSTENLSGGQTEKKKKKTQSPERIVESAFWESEEKKALIEKWISIIQKNEELLVFFSNAVSAIEKMRSARSYKKMVPSALIPSVGVWTAITQLNNEPAAILNALSLLAMLLYLWVLYSARPNLPELLPLLISKLTDGKLNKNIDSQKAQYTFESRLIFAKLKLSSEEINPLLSSKVAIQVLKLYQEKWLPSYLRRKRLESTNEDSRTWEAPNIKARRFHE